MYWLTPCFMASMTFSFWASAVTIMNSIFFNLGLFLIALRSSRPFILDMFQSELR